MANNTPFNMTDVLNPDEIESVGRNKLYNIIASGVAITALSYYMKDRQNDMLKKAGTMMAGQLFGATLVDILQRSGKIDDAESTVGKTIEALAAGGFYSVVAIQGLKLPNVSNKQFQEAVLGSVAGSIGGPTLRGIVMPPQN
jgi:hypothetical protein